MGPFNKKLKVTYSIFRTTSCACWGRVKLRCCTALQTSGLKIMTFVAGSDFHRIRALCGTKRAVNTSLEEAINEHLGVLDLCWASHQGSSADGTLIRRSLRNCSSNVLLLEVSPPEGFAVLMEFTVSAVCPPMRSTVLLTNTLLKSVHHMVL